MLTRSAQPPPPDWLAQGLDRLRKAYPDDRFEGLMKHTAIDPKTQKLVSANESNTSFPHKYVPRIRCLDCPGKAYMPDVDGFESHLKNRNHRTNVDERLAKKPAA
jgi:SWI/SNF-related matrix-associated actin-dependent regulator of chromatin subfamily B protein 1